MSKVSLKILVLKYIFVSISAVTLAVTGAYYINLARIYLTHQAVHIYGQAIGAITRTEIVREYVSVEDVPINELVARAAREHNVPEIALKAIVAQESANGSDRWLYNFEPLVYDRRAERDREYTDDERRMRASSHGITQVMGFNAEPRCGVHWSKLYIPAVSVDCGARILAEELYTNRSVLDPVQRLRAALRSYNGTGPQAEAYSQRVMARIGELLMRDATAIVAAHVGNPPQQLAYNQRGRGGSNR